MELDRLDDARLARALSNRASVIEATTEDEADISAWGDAGLAKMKERVEKVSGLTVKEFVGQGWRLFRSGCISHTVENCWSRVHLAGPDSHSNFSTYTESGD